MKKLLSLILSASACLSSYAFTGHEIVVTCNPANGSATISDGSGNNQNVGSCGFALSQVSSAGYTLQPGTTSSTSNYTSYTLYSN